MNGRAHPSPDKPPPVSGGVPLYWEKRVDNKKRMNLFRQLFSELHRRGVFKAAGIYLAAGWLLIQVIDVALTPIGLPPWALSLSIWLVLVGFPVTVAFSWRYDVSLDGIRLTPPTDDVAPEDLRIRKTDLVLLALGAVTVVALTFYLGSMVSQQQEAALEAASPSPVPLDNAIAVLPFENLGGDEENYLGRGLAEDILHRLASIDGLPVTSRTSSFELNRSGLDIPEIGRRLGARHVLEGSVRRSGDRVRIVAQLIDASNDQHLWSHSYDRDLSDLFRIYDEISLAIVSELQLTLAPDTELVVAPPTGDMEAYDYFLQARSILQRATDVTTANNALIFFGRAVERDPRFAMAWAGQCHAWLESHEFEPDPAKVDSARTSCERAIELNPGLAEGRVAMGDLLRSQGEPEQAVTQYREALKTDQKLAIAWRGLGRAQETLGSVSQAELALSKAVEVEPNDLLNLYALGDFYFYQGRYEEAEAVYETLSAHPQASVSAFNTLGASRSMLGDFEGAAEAFRQVISLEATDIAYANVGVIYYLMGRYPDAQVMLEQAIALSPDDPYHWSNLGDVRRELTRDGTRARDAYRRAAELGAGLLDLNPRDAELMTNQAHCLSRLGDDEGAMALIERVMAEAPNDPYAYYYAALVHLEAQRTDAALGAIARALELNYPLPQLLADPQFAGLASHAGYRQLLDSARAEEETQDDP